MRAFAEVAGPQIDVPERPIQILFGGSDRRTLFILAHHTLYAVTTQVAGQAVTWP